MNTIESENLPGLTFRNRQSLAFTHGKGSLEWDVRGKSRVIALTHPQGR